MRVFHVFDWVVNSVARPSQKCKRKIICIQTHAKVEMEGKLLGIPLMIVLHSLIFMLDLIINLTIGIHHIHIYERKHNINVFQKYLIITQKITSYSQHILRRIIKLINFVGQIYKTKHVWLWVDLTISNHSSTRCGSFQPIPIDF